jgi:hypothetical protein
MLKRRWFFSALLGLVASMLLNLGVVVWNSNGTHNRFAESFFTLGSLVFPGFESGVLAAAANTIVFALVLTLITRVFIGILAFY